MLPPVEHGKIPPQSIDLEEAVLGALMLDKDAWYVISDMLTAECFYKPAHEYVFRAISDLFENRSAIDILTVTQQLRSNGNLEEAGGPLFVTELTNRVAGIANLMDHAKVVKQNWMKREMIKIGSSIVSQAYEDTTDSFDVLASSQDALYELQADVDKGTTTSFKDSVQNYQDILDGKKEDDTIMIPIPDEFYGLRKALGYWYGGQVVILAARPSQGKSAFIVSIMLASILTVKVGVISPDQSTLQNVQRMLAQMSGVNLKDIKSGRILKEGYEGSKGLVQQAAINLKNRNFEFDDESNLTLPMLRSKCKVMVRKKGVNLIVIDFMQRISDPKAFKEITALNNVSKGIKVLARELKIPIIALSQIGRDAVTGKVKMPKMSNVKGSGNIEEDADVVVAIHRAEAYGEEEMASGKSSKGMAEVVILKNKDGDTQVLEMVFEKKTVKFSEEEPEYIGGGTQTSAFVEPKEEEDVPPDMPF